MSTLSGNKLDQLNKADSTQLKSNANKDELIAYIQLLRNKVEELSSYQLIAKRVQLLERSHVNSLQYQRRESLEIHGIPDEIRDNELESKCREILLDVTGQKVKKFQIHACHRLKTGTKQLFASFQESTPT